MSTARTLLQTELTTNHTSYTKDQLDRLIMLHRVTSEFAAAVNRFSDAAPSSVTTALNNALANL